MKTGTITRKIDSALSSLDKEFSTLYGKEDFKHKIRLLRQAEGKSNRPSILASLYEMLDACGVPYERGRNTSYYEDLIQSPLVEEHSNMEERMLLALYREYRKYPSPDVYMLRIVERLSCPDDGWNEDSLRVRILKQFIRYGRFMEWKDDSGKTVTLAGGKREIQKYVKQKLGKNKAPSEEEVLRYLDDGIFLAFELEIADARSRLNEMGEEAKAEKKKAREKIKALGKLSGKYGLLKLADDLAAGKFRTQGSTKRCLYWFGMVYPMTYYTGKGDQEYDSWSDLEKNLFQDYYTNNLMRFITDAYKGRLCEYELDPPGQGINYKNFAEVIYLYFIAKDYTPLEKIRRSAEMIKRVQEKYLKQTKGCFKAKQQETVFYRAYFCADKEQFHENALNLSEKEFEQFVCDNYDCSTYVNDESGTDGRRVGELQIASEQNTAYKNYQKILKKLHDMEVELEHCNYGLWFTDVSAFRKKGHKILSDKRHDLDKGKFEEFMELLFAINSFLGYTVLEKVSEQSKAKEREQISRMKTKALFVQSAKDITRTSMIVAYYYYYNALHEGDGKDQWKNFGEVFRSFKSGVDEILLQSYYQPLNGKSIFDVLVVFSSYAYLNL